MCNSIIALGAALLALIGWWLRRRYSPSPDEQALDRQLQTADSLASVQAARRAR